MSSMTVKMRAILLAWLGLLLLLHANGNDVSREEYLKLKMYLKRINKPAVKSIEMCPPMTFQMRAILLVWASLFLVLCNGDIVSREEYLTLMRHLKRVNKPAVKSIKTEYGDIFDCVDIYKQLAFDHPLLKNHTLLMRPASIPSWTNEKSSSDQRSSVPKTGAILGEGCPEGTVPIRRTRIQDLLRAPSLYLYAKKYEENGTYAGNSMLQNNPQAGHHYAIIQARQGTFYGTKVDMNLWNPRLSADAVFSLAQYWIIGGPVESLNTIEVGWMVNSWLFGDQRTRLFTYWTADGYTKTGCYDTLCEGFVQTNPKIPLGFSFPNTSTYDGEQWSAILQTTQDATGNWWLYYDEDSNVLGYFPRDLFPVLGSGPATGVDWGGETYSPSDVCPPMGSGHFPYEGARKASFMRGIKVMNQTRQPEDAPLNTGTVADIPQNYRVIDPRVISPEPEGRSFFYGGPGGSC